MHVDLHHTSYKHTGELILRYDILLAVIRFWVYQILFHYDNSWFYECDIW